MKITIGSNIKRLRSLMDITQEQLAEAMNVSCAAVSKWERAETYPDITLLQPLAFYFHVSLDELMGYDREKISEEIEARLEEYRKYWISDREKARGIIMDAYREYPNDFWVMHYYMWNLGGEMADNDPKVLLAHKEEFLTICEKIIAGCTEETLRLNAWNMKAKILHAEGDTAGALAIYDSKYANWFHTVGQKSEQLFAKDTPEFLYYVRRNMYELADFAADKLVKSHFFDPEEPYERKVAETEKCGDEAYKIGIGRKEAFFVVEAHAIYKRLHNDLKYRGGKDADVVRILEKYLAAAEKLSTLAAEDKALCDALVRPRGTGDLLDWTVDGLLTNKRPQNVRWLKNDAYGAVIGKYKKKK